MSETKWTYLLEFQSREGVWEDGGLAASEANLPTLMRRCAELNAAAVLDNRGDPLPWRVRQAEPWKRKPGVENPAQPASTSEPLNPGDPND